MGVRREGCRSPRAGRIRAVCGRGRGGVLRRSGRVQGARRPGARPRRGRSPLRRLPPTPFVRPAPCGCLPRGCVHADVLPRAPSTRLSPVRTPLLRSPPAHPPPVRMLRPRVRPARMPPQAFDADTRARMAASPFTNPSTTESTERASRRMPRGRPGGKIGAPSPGTVTADADTDAPPLRAGNADTSEDLSEADAGTTPRAATGTPRIRTQSRTTSSSSTSKPTPKPARTPVPTSTQKPARALISASTPAPTPRSRLDSGSEAPTSEVDSGSESGSASEVRLQLRALTLTSAPTPALRPRL